MDVLLGWSKERSKLMASSLHEWLPKVLPSIKPWMSEKDISKGKDWFDELDGFLNGAKAVIVCLTPENIHSPWIYYECGHIAGRSKTNLVYPYCIENLSKSLSDGPLRRFQHTKAEKEDTFRLVKSLNSQLSEILEPSRLEINFERAWADLHGTISRILDMQVTKEPNTLQVQDDSENLAGGSLNDTERLLILETGKDKHGSLYRLTTRGGHHFETDGKDLNSENTPRSTANFEAALNRLVRLQLLSMVGKKGQCFRLSAKGFQVFDKLNGERNN
tara:strand:+ start:71405 stop:72229 length:825 start_codon:yes stop_codon:yes gene_type:complete